MNESILIITDKIPKPPPFRQCIRKGHKWLSLCDCGAARVCERCGEGEGTIPCDQCMVTP